MTQDFDAPADGDDTVRGGFSSWRRGGADLATMGAMVQVDRFSVGARCLLAAAAVMGLLGVGFGAFGAHGLQEVLVGPRLDWFRTATLYHLVHAVAAAAVAVLAGYLPGRLVLASGWAMVAGVVVFSGSLYLMAVSDWRWLGAVTPVGGLLMMAGWAMLAVSAGRGAR